MVSQQHVNSFIRPLFSGLAGLFLLMSPARGAKDCPEAQPFDKVLSRVVGTLISSQHYTRRPLNDHISQQWFDEYFAALDREKRFFLAADIEEFQAYRKSLDNHVYAGNLDFAFNVYDRYLQRVRERVAYARQRLQEPFDFTVDEELALDREDAPWAATTAELDEIWRKQLKNRVLVFTLVEEAAEKEAAEEAEKARENPPPSGEENTAENTAQPPLSPFVKKTPVERVLNNQELFLSYVEENESIDVLEIYLSSLTRVYDPHSSYMAPMTEEDFDINMKLSLEGIGAMLTTEDGYVKITDVIEGGPAGRDGRLKAGDRIVAVAQEGGEAVDVVDMPLRKVVRQIRGEKGSTVFLSVIEAGKSLASVPTTIDIVRDEVALTEKGAKSDILTVDVPPEDTGRPGIPAQVTVQVIKLPTFYSDFEAKRKGEKDYRSAARDVRKLLEDGKEKGVSGVILDLRSNGGGSLEEAIELAGLFFSSGPVVQVKGAGSQREIHRDNDKDIVYSGPLAVLVNRMSASASEIVAAAIQDHHRGVIIGDASTHGKGTVQTVYDLQRLFSRDPTFRNEKTGSLKFTIAKFYRVNGESTQLRGVIPDIRFPAFTDHMDIGEADLEHALRWDTTQALDITPDIDITPYFPELDRRVKERVSKDPEFVKYQEGVAHYGELRARKTIPLNIDTRRRLQEEEKEWIDQIRSQTYGEVLDDEGGEDDKDAPDIVLDESVNIIRDLIALQQKDQLIAAPKN
ncbi:MAG: carboxy terminal-processing peptidase [Lentisphaeria bacterium]|nr:carboxy terminal-processing peptidase [Lentisphaeria bacterium]